MNEKEIIAHQAEISETAQKAVQQGIAPDKEKLLLEGLSKINQKETKSPEDTLNQMFEKVRLYADLGYTLESKAMLETAEAYSISREYLEAQKLSTVSSRGMDSNEGHEVPTHQKLNPADILSSPL